MRQALQDDKIEKMALDGDLYFGVIHSMGKKRNYTQSKNNQKTNERSQLT
jgi:hypothetical protein